MSVLCFNNAIEEIEVGIPSLGFRMLQELADEGYEQAQLHVGCAYLLGHVNHSRGKYKVQKNIKSAIKYLYHAAKQGNRDALHNLKEIRKNTPLNDYVTQERT